MARRRDVNKAVFRFYAELNDFLPASKRQQSFTRGFKGAVSVKHLIEALGVPHTEVDVILANGRPVDFSYLAGAGDRIAVYPSFTTLDVTAMIRVRPPWPNPFRFILDSHLGKLASYLRLLGFDTYYRNDYDDLELARVSAEEARILLTRDRALLKRRQVVFGYCLRTRDSKKQLRAVLRRFKLYPLISPWRRCLRCNGPLHPVAKEDIIDRLEPKTKIYYNEFHKCRSCDHIYWKGSHYAHMQAFLDEVMYETHDR